ncbi:MULTISPECIES: HEAT repeat domain-containing protein [Cyanophyceae]|uniref:peptidoglycan-binding protein n=1 Tax=Cyanophyceae TaxID=3028117 RepID=UPI001681DDAA|nr:MULTISPECIES: HEAT repeat domain-containing protein [Cyanophyceae]MBD1916546.1 HEAT repeat domain-containing protein [Phormidium sp. FACHB-77]MBD2032113.1 HEAT repeat domain-containing protein [Phormidium sp. FACHB-322]MBD2052993.1 HEAT repeat domain-containing protein [Leptolyngbya sp. FACHB-60]
MTGLLGLEAAIAKVTTAPESAQSDTRHAQTAIPAPNSVLLQPGAEGDDVIMLQRQMRLLGLYQGPVDGRYGGPTQEAIASFQSKAGLPASGTLDQVTWQHMSTPQLLTENTPAEPEIPVLFPTAEEPAPSAATPVVATANASVTPVSAESPDAETAAPVESPAGEGQELAEPAAVENGASVETAESSRRWIWLGLGGLALVGCLGGWWFLGQGRSAKRSTTNSERLPSAESQARSSAEPSPDDSTMAGHIGTLSPALGLATPAAAANDLTLDPTTRLTSGDIVNSLIHELDNHDGAVRRHAIWELGQRGHSEAIQPLINGLLDADSQEKSLILAALAEISSRSLKPMHRALALGLQDPSPEVRKNAIRDLSRIYDTVVQLSHMLAQATQDPDVGVQETAQWALSQLNRIPAATYSGALPPETNSLDSPYDSEGQRLTPEGHRLPPAN